MARRRIRAYLAPGRAKHGQRQAADDKRFKNIPWMSAMVATLKRAGRSHHIMLLL